MLFTVVVERSTVYETRARGEEEAIDKVLAGMVEALDETTHSAKVVERTK